ncbi:hypothetical protein [Nocardioides sp. SR21]|uniref:hypothetical protein n=1 Tax=Nocardioides sp. SR21 TaxID=2919501 RepID=UPI001FAAF00C|nr:hypothetical protein [Nocardioides sp. SR21]
MANPTGFRYLCRYYEGTASLATLDYCLTKGYITLVEYERALTGEPPIGYVPTPTAASAAAQATAE